MYLRGVLISLDRFFNALCNGDHNVTISARVGYHSWKFRTDEKLKADTWSRILWVTLESVIDWVFQPIDGWYHCSRAYRSSADMDYNEGSKIAQAVLALLVILFAFFTGLPIRIIRWLMPSFMRGEG